MALFLVTAPAEEPVSLDEAKLQCRVDIDQHDEDAFLDSLIRAATLHVETFTHRALIEQTWDETFDEFPCGYRGELWLSKPPVSAITSISYVDTSGATQAWGASNYTTDLPSGSWARRARIVAAYGIVYPITRSVINAVTVRFVCGYGDPDDVPAPITAAMKLLIAHWYMNREAVSNATGVVPSAYPHAVDALLWPFKAF